jgi:hypothetical protein
MNPFIFTLVFGAEMTLNALAPLVMIALCLFACGLGWALIELFERLDK